MSTLPPPVAPHSRQRAFAPLAVALALLTPGCTSASAPGDAKSPAPPPRDLAISLRSFSIDGAEQSDNGYLFWFFDKQAAEGRSLKLRVLGPRRASHAPHKHDGHEFFYVLEGQAEFFLDGQTRVAGPHSALHCAPWSMHGIRNAGTKELKYLVIKEYVDSFPER